MVYRFQQKRVDVPVGHDFHAAGDTAGEFYDAALGFTEQYAIANLYEYGQAVKITDANVLKHYQMINYTTTNYSNVND